MAKADDLLKDMIRFHGRRVAKDVMGDLPAQVKQARKVIRTLQKEIAALTKKVDQLLETTRTEAPVLAAPEEEVEKARFTKRTLPALRKRFGLTQKDLAKLLDVASLTVSSWERGKSRPRAESMARIIALRTMSQEQVAEALGRQPASPAMSPQQIKGLRQKLGLGQGELAKLLGVWAVTVGTWERGRSAPGASNRKALAQLKAMAPGELDRRLGRTGATQPAEKPAEQTELSPAEILSIRKKSGLSQKGLADVVGVSSNSVSNWETGSTSPRQESVRKLLAVRK